jgi:hypothetical protein
MVEPKSQIAIPYIAHQERLMPIAAILPSRELGGTDHAQN